MPSGQSLVAGHARIGRLPPWHKMGLSALSLAGSFRMHNNFGAARLWTRIGRRQWAEHREGACARLRPSLQLTRGVRSLRSNLLGSGAILAAWPHNHLAKVFEREEAVRLLEIDHVVDLSATEGQKYHNTDLRVLTIQPRARHLPCRRSQGRVEAPAGLSTPLPTPGMPCGDRWPK